MAVTLPCQLHSMSLVVLTQSPKANWAGLCDNLLDVDFSPCCDDDDDVEVVNMFKLIILSAIEKFIPQVK